MVSLLNVHPRILVDGVKGVDRVERYFRQLKFSLFEYDSTENFKCKLINYFTFLVTNPLNILLYKR